MSSIPATMVGDLFTNHYDELLKIARALRRNRQRSTLDTSALVHEAFLKISNKYEFSDDTHFLKSAAIAIRQILIDYARRKLRDKRGGGINAVVYRDDMGFEPADLDEIITVASALDTLRTMDDRLVSVVDCRFFVGYTEDETAAILNITSRTVRRDWAKAKSVLRVLLEDSAPA